MKRMAAFAFAVLAASGCLQWEPKGPDHDAIAAALRAAALPALELEHGEEGGHRRGALHAGAYRMELVGYSNGVDDSGDPNRIPAKATFNELAVTPRHVYLSGASADGSFGGFSIIDIEDRSHPRVVGRFAAQNGTDIEVNPEETLAFLSTQRTGAPQVAGAVQESGDARAGLPRGIYVVDIADKRSPAFDGFVPLPANGPHTLTFHRHANGSDYLLACTYDLVTDPATQQIVAAAPATQRLIVFLVQPNPAPVGPSVFLLPVAQHQANAPAPQGKMFFPHDTRVHEQDGKTLITLAYWDRGVRILDFTHPPAPAMGVEAAPQLAEVGAFTDFSPSAFNAMHLAQAFQTPAGRWVTVAEPEIIAAAGETGQITLLDTTDPARPSRLGWWNLTRVNPDLAVRDLDFSPHNFDVWEGKIALAHNHAGVWVIDVASDANLAHPREVGFYMTGAPHGIERRASPTLSPRTWGVFEMGGLLFASDEGTGLHVLRYMGP